MKTFKHGGKEYYPVKSEVGSCCHFCEIDENACMDSSDRGFNCEKWLKGNGYSLWHYFKEIKPEVVFGPEHVGENVYCQAIGNCEIIDYTDGVLRPVVVKTKTGSNYYFTTTGKLSHEYNERTLYFGHDLKFSVEGEVIPDIKKKMWIVVVQDESGFVVNHGSFEDKESVDLFEKSYKRPCYTVKIKEVEI